MEKETEMLYLFVMLEIFILVRVSNVANSLTKNTGNYSTNISNINNGHDDVNDDDNAAVVELMFGNSNGSVNYMKKTNADY